MYLGADSIYAINLKRHKKRFQLLKDIEKELDIDINIIEGIDNKDVVPLTPKFIKSYLPPKFFDPGGMFSIGIICCALSHRKAYKAFLDSGDEIGLFLEDDAMPTHYIHNYDFKKIREELDNLDWGVCWYGKWEHDMRIEERLSENLYNHPPHVDKNHAAHAYLLNRKSAQWFYDNTEKIKYAADIRLEFSPFNQISLDHSIFIQKHREFLFGNKDVIWQEEWWHSTMDDVKSVRHFDGYRKYPVGTFSKMLPIKSKEYKTIFHKGKEILGREYELYV